MKLDLSEPLRYLGVRGEPDPALYAEMSAVADKLTQAVEPRYIYRVFPLVLGEEGPTLEGTGLTLTGEMAHKMLADCSQAVLLACTLGAGFESMLRAEQARSMARAAMLDVCGSAWVEAGCDEAEQEISARFPGLYLTDRFSPGYGDLPLELQRDICALLDAQRRLGVQVTDSLLMNPTKSVTAVIGLSGHPQPARIRGCGFCSFRENCQYREEGKTCGT
ncbi:MAG: methionine synthase [Clostridiales bacterium]|nr:methionine synthase [Clostridiales bacterium]